MSDMIDVQVIGDAFMWMEIDPGSKKGLRHRGEMRGWRGPVPVEIADKGIAAGVLMTAEEADLVRNETASAFVVPTEVTDEQIGRMNVAEIHALLNQSPGLDMVQRVNDLELARERPRSGVMDIVDAKLAEG